MKAFFIKHIISISIIAAIIIAAVGSIWYVSSNTTPSFTTIAATEGNVVESLNEPATAAAENNVDLSFQEAGEISQVNVSEGQVVGTGAVLATLDSASLQAAVQEANAAVVAAQANLGEIASGTRPQQITIDQTAVTNAQATVSVDIGNAYSSADDAVRNQTDVMFENPTTNNPVFLVPTDNSQDLNNIDSSRLTIESELDAWYAALNSTSSDPSALQAMANTTLSDVQSYLDLLALQVNSATPSGNVTASALAGYKINIATARAEVAGAITAVTNAESAVQSAENTLTLAQAGSTPQDIAAQQAVVAQAQAGAAAAQVALNNSALVAPFPGTVQNLTAQVGQVVSPGVPVLTLVNNAGLKIEAYVSETDVANVKVGDAANITLDAYGASTTFPATVTTIDDVETQVNGTNSYLVTLHFTNAEPQIKDGMTGNAQIILAEDDNVVEVPSRLVINNGNDYFVLVAGANGQQQQVPVQIGIVGDNGMTEIKSGITAGEQLVNF